MGSVNPLNDLLLGFSDGFVEMLNSLLQVGNLLLCFFSIPFGCKLSFVCFKFRLMSLSSREFGSSNALGF